MRRKEIVIENDLDVVIQIISLAIVQNHLATKIKKPSLEVLGAIAKMTLRTKLTMKLVSWLNRQMSPPSTKLSPLVDDDVGEEEAIENNTKVVNNSNKEDKSIEVDEVVNIKESKNHPLEQVIEPKNVNEALEDESWVIAMQEELNQFVANNVWDLVPLPMSQTVKGTTWVFRYKLDENGIVSRNKARLVAQGYNQ
ncbi:retrovirus-related pol polyprotein from transposon TNT 1-94 [Tanacetum coccineum]|uniref:Retrovirus-related pol polyprotein from transposon TNT 1-94 n=1 Tax=Tanacetum coccineum TaxID=301880 RepID=A0ABQ5A5L7_9ASTR